MKVVVASSFLGLLAVSTADLPPILDPAPFTTWVATSSDGLSRRANIVVPFTNSTGGSDFVNMWRGDLIGDAMQRGIAHGELFANEIVELINSSLPEFFDEMISEIDLSTLPDWLANIIYQSLEEHGSTAFFNAMQAVWDHEAMYVPPRLVTEMNAIAQGVCNTLTAQNKECDVEQWEAGIHQVNMLPELLKMTCTMFGAWGASRPESTSGSLLQLRALDFGSSPFSNYSMLQVHRPPTSPNSSQGKAVVSEWPSPGGLGDDAGNLIQAFASLSFPGFVGVITGISERGIGLSEKVWLQSNVTGGKQPGAYDGEADVLVMRDVLELALNRQSAEDYMRNMTRTWAIFLGVGDYQSQEMDIVGYRAPDFHAYTPETMPAVTSQPYFEDLVYVDKHAQPSADTTLSTLLTQFYGNMTMYNTKTIVATHETGDLHIAVYDYGTNSMWLSVGRINAAGNFGPDGHVWKACYRPFLQFNLPDLWAGV